MSAVTELIELPPKEAALDVYQNPQGLDPWLRRIRDQVTGIVPDVSTDKGRKEIASRAFKVRKSKTALDNLGKQLVDDLKEIPKKIDAERKRMRDTLDALADEVRAPLDEWEAAEQERVAKHKHEIAMLEGFSNCGDLDAAMIRANLEHIESLAIDESWEEFETEAHRVKTKTLEALRTALAAREKYEAEQAELAELRRKQAEQERKDREAEIARQAAEKARADAEAAAQAEREAAARREADAKAAAERAEREKLEAIERQEQAEARAEAERLAAEQRAKQAAEAARQAEIDRIAREKEAAEVEQRRREADKAHKAKINRAALQAFIDGGMPEDCAKLAVTLIAKGEIPAVRISY